MQIIEVLNDWRQKLAILRRLDSLEKKMESSTLAQAQADAKLRAQGLTLSALQAQIEALKADATAIKNDNDALNTALVNIAKAVQDMAQKVADLQAQVDAGNAIDLTDVVASFDAAKAQADQILAAAQAIPGAVPPPPPPPVEVPAPPAEVPPTPPTPPADSGGTPSQG